VTVHVLHRDVVALLDPAEVEDLHDARVGEARHHLGLVHEHVEELLVVREVGQDAFERHDLLEALDARPLRLEDLGHAADRHPVEELVGPEAVVAPRRLARRGGGRLRGRGLRLAGLLVDGTLRHRGQVEPRTEHDPGVRDREFGVRLQHRRG